MLYDKPKSLKALGRIVVKCLIHVLQDGELMSVLTSKKSDAAIKGFYSKITREWDNNWAQRTRVVPRVLYMLMNRCPAELAATLRMTYQKNWHQQAPPVLQVSLIDAYTKAFATANK